MDWMTRSAIAITLNYLSVRYVTYLRWSLFFLSLALSIGSATAREKWLFARSEHFEMLSAVPERDTRALLTELEEFRASLATLFPVTRVREPRTRIVLFESYDAFEPYMPLYQGKTKPAGGYFLTRPDELMIALFGDHTSDRNREIIYHEYVHLQVSLRAPDIPLWLNEGLAELYATFSVDGDTVEFGKVHDSHITFLRQNALMPLKTLFAVRGNSPEYNESTHQGIFYAESWALLHMWMCGADTANRAKVGEFLVALNQSSSDTAAAFRSAFGEDYTRIEVALRQYLDAGRYYVRRGHIPALAAVQSIRCRPASDFERELMLLDLRWRIREPADSLAQAFRLSEQQPNSPLAYELIASMATHNGDLKEAREYWQRAVDHQSDNPYAYWRLADDELRGLASAIQMIQYRFPETTATRLRGWLDQAVALSPDYMEAYASLATVEAWAPKPRLDVVSRVQAALPFMRDKTRPLIAMAVLRWRLNDSSTCREIAEHVLKSGKADAAQKALLNYLLKQLPLAPAKTVP
jgi:tetratricopeptide (TPR) repeat protein